jgi:hypothetical protein
MNALQHHSIAVVQAAGDQHRTLGILRDADPPQLEGVRPGMQNPYCRRLAFMKQGSRGQGK